MLFADRIAAGRQLAQALAAYKGKDCVVYALPRGGVPVAAEVATFLGAPLDLLLVRKIGVPHYPELAMGAVVDGGAPIVVHNREVMTAARVRTEDFDAVCQNELAEIERRRKHYMGNKTFIGAKGRIAIVIDDGIATGATMRAALQATRQRGPQKLILAVPVAPRETLDALRPEVDEIVCLASPEPFGAVGLFYGNFEQTTDEEVITLLAQNQARMDTDASFRQRRA
jgi:predicted phosphoribosyltransferase